MLPRESGSEEVSVAASVDQTDAAYAPDPRNVASLRVFHSGFQPPDFAQRRVGSHHSVQAWVRRSNPTCGRTRNKFIIIQIYIRTLRLEAGFPAGKAGHVQAILDSAYVDSMCDLVWIAHPGSRLSRTPRAAANGSAGMATSIIKSRKSGRNRSHRGILCEVKLEVGHRDGPPEAGHGTVCNCPGLGLSCPLGAAGVARNHRDTKYRPGLGVGTVNRVLSEAAGPFGNGNSCRKSPCRVRQRTRTRNWMMRRYRSKWASKPERR